MRISDLSSDVCSSDLIAVNLVVSLALLVWVRKQDGPLLIWAVGLVVGGAVGNAVDRFHQPGVVDFLDFHLAGWHWPAFNVARSEEHTSELQSLMRISYAVFCLKKKTTNLVSQLLVKL